MYFLVNKKYFFNFFKYICRDIFFIVYIIFLFCRDVIYCFI